MFGWSPMAAAAAHAVKNNRKLHPKDGNASQVPIPLHKNCTQKMALCQFFCTIVTRVPSCFHRHYNHFDELGGDQQSSSERVGWDCSNAARGNCTGLNHKTCLQQCCFLYWLQCIRLLTEFFNDQFLYWIMIASGNVKSNQLGWCSI